MTYNRSSANSGYTPQGGNIPADYQDAPNFPGNNLYYQQVQAPIPPTNIQQVSVQGGQPLPISFTRQYQGFQGHNILPQGPLHGASQTGPVSAENKTTISTYTYNNYVPSVSQPIPNYQPGQTFQQYQPPQTVQYTNVRPAENGVKSNMDLTLEKIDEQLQMSRKMFPSWYWFPIYLIIAIVCYFSINF